MSFGNRDFRSYYGEEAMDSFFESFHKCLLELVQLAKDKNLNMINFIGDKKPKMAFS